MKVNRRLVWVGLAVTLLLVITGCSPSQRELFNAAMKMQTVKSMQQHTSMTFHLSGSGFEPSVQQQVDTAAMFLNSGKLDLDIKTSGNEQKTAVKSQINMNLALQGMDINMPVWVDTDLTGNTPKATEIIKLPLMAKASLPPQFASKEYIVMNPFDMNSSGTSNIDMTKLMEFSKGFQEAELKFLTSYSQRFKPNFEAVGHSSQYMQTDDGLKLVTSCEIKLNDAQFKDLIRYTVNNLVQDDEAVAFVKEYMDTILEMSHVPDQAKSLNDFNQVFEDFDVTKQYEFLAKFNTLMDQLKDVTLLGDKGIKLEYAIYNGYFIKNSGAINLKFDVSQMNRLMNTLSGQESATVDAKGTVDLMVNYSTDFSGIDKPVEIQIPDVNSSNSLNYQDLINLSTNKAKISQQLSGDN
ncbi:MAG: hypothetical protein APF81_01980 [Desulfosporosinus sp. BRH_c37]|nr:MAG: hypothetical protein APF81_01980 [Desulfosporosinus sp. BRH_c37]